MKIKVLLFCCDISNITSKYYSQLENCGLNKLTQFTTNQINGFDTVHYNEFCLLIDNFELLSMYHDSKHMYGVLQDFDNEQINYCFINLNGLRNIYNKYINVVKSLNNKSITNIDFLAISLQQDFLTQEQLAISKYTDLTVNINNGFNYDVMQKNEFLTDKWKSFEKFKIK